MAKRASNRWLRWAWAMAVGAMLAQGAAAASEPLIPVSGFVVSGATAFPAEELEELLAEDVGERTLMELETAAAKVTARYRSAGYPLARAYVPAQEIGSDGIVEIAVIEGRYGAITVQNTSRLRDEVVRGLLGPIRHGDVVAGGPLVRSIRLLEEVPGVTVQAGLAPGEAAGTSNLVVQVADAERVLGAVGIDNAGNESTGQIRGLVTLSLGNPSGAGDRMDLQVVTSGAGMQQGRGAYERPAGAGGMRWQVSAGITRYAVGGAPAALELRGATSSVALGLRVPHVRAAVGTPHGAERVDWHVEGSWRRMEDEAAGFVVPRQVTALAVGAEAMGRRGAAAMRGSLTVTWGRLAILEATERALDAAGPRTAGAFWKARGEAAIERAIGRNGLAQVRLRGQMASRNLHTSERFAGGGARGVRALASGSLSGDHGVSLQVEASEGLGLSGMRWRAFVDGAAVQVESMPVGGGAPDVRTAVGAGVGVVASWGNGVEAELWYAVPLGGSGGEGRVGWEMLYRW